MNESEDKKLDPCPNCGSTRWIKWADGQNHTCQKCGNFYLKKPVKVIGKLGELKDAN